MKLSCLMAVLILAASCSLLGGDEDVWVAPPAPPESWVAVLGAPEWHFRWYDADGSPRARSSADGVSASLPSAVAVPVLAYPHWPRAGIPVGVFRPAGAVAPFGLSGDTLETSWTGGVAAVFYEELLRAEGPASRGPERFDWPRFLELLDSDTVGSAVRDDPWTVDWRTVAARTRASGFDRRRIVPRKSSTLRVPAPAEGVFLPSSPFIGPISPSAGHLVLESVQEPDSLVSEFGILRHSVEAWAWFPSSFPEGRLDNPAPFR